MNRKHKNSHDNSTRLGIDIGRVIISPFDLSGDDTQFLNGSEAVAMQTPPSPGAFEVIRELSEACAGNIWIVSKCGPKIEARSRRWLAHHDFYTRAGVDPRRLCFCRARKDKAEIALKLGLTHFIDDRVDVLGHLTGLVRHRYLFGPQREPIPAWAIAVPDWQHARAAVLARVSCR